MNLILNDFMEVFVDSAQTTSSLLAISFALHWCMCFGVLSRTRIDNVCESHEIYELGLSSV